MNDCRLQDEHRGHAASIARRASGGRSCRCWRLRPCRCSPAAPKRDSITVGAVPDDYRTNHPIVIAEKDEVLDLPVAAGDRGMTQSQRDSLDGFLDGYDGAPRRSLTITVPLGSAQRARRRRRRSRHAQFLRAPRRSRNRAS